MELIVMTTLCFVLLALLTPSASLQIQVQPSHERANELQHYSLPALPRKLRLFEEVTVKEYGGQDSTSYNEEYVAGKQAKHNNKEQVNKIIKRSKLIMWCMETKGHGENGWREVQMSQSFIQWIIPVLEEDLPYITSPCRLLHETWDQAESRVSDFIPRVQVQINKLLKSLFGYSFGKSN